MKVKYRRNGFSGFLKVEANSIHALQGVAGVPLLYGVVEEEVTFDHGEFSIDFALVTAFAQGQPIMKVKEYIEKEAAKKYYARKGVNIHGSVGRQLARYLRGSMEERLVDTYLSERNIFLHLSGSAVEVTKIDQGHVKNRRDEDAGFDFEVWDHKYEDAMKDLLALGMIDVSCGFRRNLAIPSNNQERYKQVAKRYRSMGLTSFSNLLDAYADGEFDTNTCLESVSS